MLKTVELRMAAGTVWTAITAFELLRRELQHDPLQAEAEDVLIALIHMRCRVLERIPCGIIEEVAADAGAEG